MAKVKPDAFEKVAFATGLTSDPTMTGSADTQRTPSDADHDLAWARNGLRFEVGSSSWAERGQAIAQAYGGKAEAAVAAGISPSTFKSQLARGNPPSNSREFAQALGLSTDYVELGRPVLPADFDIEAVRLKLARGAFNPTGSTAARRIAIRQVVEELAAEIDRARFEAGTSSSGRRGAVPRGGFDDAPDDLFGPGSLEVTMGQVAIRDSSPAPIAFSREWLALKRLDPQHLALVEVRDAIYLVDTSPQGLRLVDGCIYAVVERESGFIICDWHRGPGGHGGTLAARADQAFGLDPDRDPKNIAGRVVYELAPH